MSSALEPEPPLRRRTERTSNPAPIVRAELIAEREARKAGDASAPDTALPSHSAHSPPSNSLISILQRFMSRTRDADDTDHAVPLSSGPGAGPAPTDAKQLAAQLATHLANLPKPSAEILERSRRDHALGEKEMEELLIRTKEKDVQDEAEKAAKLEAEREGGDGTGSGTGADGTVTEKDGHGAMTESPFSSTTSLLPTSPVSNDTATPLSTPPQSSLPSATHLPLEPGFGRLHPSRPASKRYDESHTVLYLAYGSNLNAHTFLKVRGIRPVAKINVVAPDYRLAFDLPGIPYSEPRFANVIRRRRTTTTAEGGESAAHATTTASTTAAAAATASIPSTGDCKGKWTKGLVGVVYQISATDYAHIIATEGGGSSYQDILVECWPLSHDDSVPVPDRPAELAGAPFKAHTLCCPRPDGSDLINARGGGGMQSEDKTKTKTKNRDVDTDGRTSFSSPPSFFDRLGTLLRSVLPSKPPRSCRPDKWEASPSARYLSLLQTGAHQNGLPAEYRAYLAAVQPYPARPSFRQRLGRFFTFLVWGPWFVFVFGVGGRLARRSRDGRWPWWNVWLGAYMFASVWMGYDWVMEPVFGDGEGVVEEC